jgi:hypothetical protein
MNVHFPAQRRWTSRLAHLAVVIVVLAVAAATFALSYTGVHAIAAQAGVPAQLARIYPGVFDAAFVIACVAALMLRDGRWWARWYAWLSIIVVVAVVGAADAVHAMNVKLPHPATAGIVAAAPWVLVLLGFSLWLTMLRQSHAQHADRAPQPTAPQSAALQSAALQSAALQPTAPEPALQPTALPAAPESEQAAVPLIPAEPPIPAEQGEAAPEETALPETTAGQEPTMAVEPEPTAVPEIPDKVTRAGQADETGDPRQATASEAGKAVSGENVIPSEDVIPGEPEKLPQAAEQPEPGMPSHDYWDTREAGEPEEPPPPFTTMPRLRRVRATPTPPDDGGR